MIPLSHQEGLSDSVRFVLGRLTAVMQIPTVTEAELVDIERRISCLDDAIIDLGTRHGVDDVDLIRAAEATVPAQQL